MRVVPFSAAIVAPGVGYPSVFCCLGERTPSGVSTRGSIAFRTGSMFWCNLARLTTLPCFNRT